MCFVIAGLQYCESVVYYTQTIIYRLSFGKEITYNELQT